MKTQTFKRILRLDSIEIKHEFDSEGMGIKAVAMVSYQMSEKMLDRRLEWLESGGLWGIETDADKAEIEDVEEQELEDLKEHLKVFGVDVSNFDSITVTRPQ